jgi:hypothetical protein
MPVQVWPRGPIFMEGSDQWRSISLESCANVTSVEGSIPLPFSHFKWRVNPCAWGASWKDDGCRKVIDLEYLALLHFMEDKAASVVVAVC